MLTTLNFLSLFNAPIPPATTAIEIATTIVPAPNIVIAIGVATIPITLLVGSGVGANNIAATEIAIAPITTPHATFPVALIL